MKLLLSDIKNTETLYMNPSFIISRVHSEEQTFIIKRVKSQVLLYEKVERLEFEFKLLKNIVSSGTINPIAFVKEKNEAFIIFENVKGLSLKSLIASQFDFSASELLQISISFLSTLKELHQYNIIHNELLPSILFYDISEGKIRIIDFSKANYISAINHLKNKKELTHESLLYLSPEQSGRMNRAVDYRSDFYSVGIILYELFSGSIPFFNTEPAEIIYSHIAKKPPSILNQLKEKFNENIAFALSSIIFKLLEKNPENRYKSSEGILNDLTYCQTLLNSDFLTDSVFIPGRKDFSSRFQIPEKLYGRSVNSIKLLKGLNKASQGKFCISIVSGETGVGKTSLVKELERITNKVYFISGKFDKLKKNIPYKTISTAFRGLVHILLTENPETLNLWKSKIINLFGSNYKTILRILPELKIILGNEFNPKSPEDENFQESFAASFVKLLKVICTKETPVILFLDDFQWIDMPTLKLLLTILESKDIQFLNIILSYKRGDIETIDPLPIIEESIIANQITSYEIKIEPLLLNDVIRLVADTLQLELPHILELAESIYTKTRGNPFFVKKLFQSLYEMGLIYSRNGSWVWNIEQIRSIPISDNAIDFVLDEVDSLDYRTLSLLKIISCFGLRIKTDFLLELCNISEEELSELIQLPIQTGLVIVKDEEIKFSHDKVQEYLYNQNTEQEKAQSHYKISSIYLKWIRENKINKDEIIFSIANHLNTGFLYSNNDDKELLFNINLEAGLTSLSSYAYESSLNFLKEAYKYLPEHHWERQFDKSKLLFISLYRAEYLNANHEMGEFYFNQIFQQLVDPLEKIKLYLNKIQLFLFLKKPIEAIHTSLNSIKSLGYAINPGSIDLKINEIIKLLVEKGVHYILDIPKLTDPKIYQLHKIIYLILVPSYIHKPEITPQLVVTLINITFTYGFSEYSLFGFITFAALLLFYKRANSLVFELSDYALKISEVVFEEDLKIKFLFYYSFLIQHCNNPKLSISTLLEIKEKALQIGDFQLAIYSMNWACILHLVCGSNLKKIQEIIYSFYHNIKNSNQNDPLYFTTMWAVSINFLTGNEENNQSNNLIKFKESEAIEHWISNHNSTALCSFYFLKAFESFLNLESEVAHNYIKTGEKYISGVLGTILFFEFYFLKGMVATFLYLQKNYDLGYKKELIKSIKRLKPSYKEALIMNKYQILIYSKRLIFENDLSMIFKFQELFPFLESNELYLEEFVIHKLLSNFWLKNKNLNYYTVHIKESCSIAKQWGCNLTVDSIKKKSSIRIQEENVPSLDNTNSINLYKELDLLTVFRASQALSGEIHTGKILEKLLKILFENAGAEKGFVILKDGDKYSIQASGDSYNNSVEVLLEKPFYLDIHSNELATSVVNYVIRTKTSVILNDAVNDSIFGNDPYIRKTNSRSVLCYPVSNAGKIVAIVYLENNFTPGAFTEERLEVLSILSSQLAISIENSILYTNLEKKVQERTEKLHTALKTVQKLKEQQDADYYLTTLLLHPLNQNKVKNAKFHFDILVKQKKIFNFNGETYDIGGDIIFSEELIIQNSNYLFFVNGDAMGKSIQGAGGVLVFGSVFKSMIERTKLTDFEPNKFDPQIWLKKSFIEVDRVFNSFEGCMLTSGIMGILDVSNGRIYYINSEHPFPIIYRNKNASFIDNSNSILSKIGSHGNEPVIINVFDLHPKDIFIVGSDGKDDIAIKKDEKGRDIINSDPNIFLSLVEKADAQLEHLFYLINERGELKDDLSILKITYISET